MLFHVPGQPQMMHVNVIELSKQTVELGAFLRCYLFAHLMSLYIPDMS